MKTTLLVMLLIGSVGLNIYLLNSPVIVQGDLDEDLIEPVDEVKLAQSSLKRVIPSHERVKHHNNIQKIERKFLPKDSDPHIKAEDTADLIPDVSNNYEQDYKQAKENWSRETTSFLELDLRFSVDEVTAYFSLMNEKEKAISDFLGELSKGKELDDKGFILNVEEGLEMAKLSKKYFDKLKAMFSGESFERYIEYKENYNKKILKNSNDGRTVFLMDM